MTKDKVSLDDLPKGLYLGERKAETHFPAHFPPIFVASQAGNVIQYKFLFCFVLILDHSWQGLLLAPCFGVTPGRSDK